MKALQALLPRARVLYSSATGASEPTNLAYMTRIGSWGFPTMLDMIKTLGRCGPRPSVQRLREARRRCSSPSKAVCL